MPRGAKGTGHQRAKQIQVVGTHKTGLEDDPEIRAAIDEDEEFVESMDADIDAAQAVEEAMENLGGSSVREYPIGNGTTVPFPFDGEQTTDVATCSPHVAGTNRGCAHHTVRGMPRCPLGTDHPLARKHKWDGGAANLVYKDLRTGMVKTCFCTTMMSTYLNMPNIVLLPGIDFYPTRTAEFKPLPNGQQPVPGPGQPRTPVVLTPHKTMLPCVPPEGLIREYQKMRRQGDFQPKERKRRRR